MPNPEISQIVVGSTLYDIKDAVARNDIAALDMVNKGRLSGGTDLDDVYDNSIYLLETNADYVHDPLDGNAGFLTTKVSGAIGIQEARRLNGVTKTRYTTDSGTTWSNWVTPS